MLVTNIAETLLLNTEGTVCTISKKATGPMKKFKGREAVVVSDIGESLVICIQGVGMFICQREEINI